MNLSRRLFYVFWRDMVSFKRFVVTTVLISLGQPLFYLITFGLGMGAYMGEFGGRPYLFFLVPGVVISSVMFTSTFDCLYETLVKILHEKLYESLLCTPVSAEDAVAGDVLWGVFRGMMSGVFMLAIGAAMGVRPVSVGGLALVLGVMVLSGFLFASLAMIVTSFAPNFDFFSYYTELCITPMLFFSGVFFPLDHFPAWVKVFAQFLPLTHAVNVSRAVFSGVYPAGLGWEILYMVGLSALAFVLALKLMKRRLIK